jgi:hypothetical protein
MMPPWVFLSHYLDIRLEQGRELFSYDTLILYKSLQIGNFANSWSS